MDDDAKKSVVQLATVKRRKPDVRFDPAVTVGIDANGQIIVTTKSGRIFHVATCEQQERELSDAVERVEAILGNPPEASA